MTYNYKDGKKRIQEVIDNIIEIEEKDYVPVNGSFTFDNAFKAWVTAIFIDIRNSTDIFTSENKKDVTKIIRSFTSEIIEILDDEKIPGNNNMTLPLEEIGIRGDCVYAIYSAKTQEHDYEVYNRACYINTLMKMLNKLFKDNNLPTIEAGIGISTSKEVIIKAGRKFSGINHKVWIGNAVTKASKLSSLGYKNGVKRIVMSKTFYDSIIKKQLAKDENATSWFKECTTSKFGHYYHCDIIIKGFNNWIKKGMK